MRSIFRIRAFDVVVVVLLVSLVGCLTLAAFSWVIPQLGLLVHFQVQYLFVLLVLAFACAVRRKWVLCSTSLFVALLPASRVVPWYIGDGSTAQTGSLVVLSSNVKATNENWSAIEEMVLSVDADIVVLLEATEPLQNFLTADVSKYPYSVGQSLDTGAGFLLYSKYPLCETVVHPNGVSNIETITTTVQSNAGEFSLVAAHPVRPGLRHGNRLNEQELSTIGTIVQSLQGDVVVIGDLNTTMWSDGYKKFVTETKLRNLRQGIGVMPTYGFMFKPIFSIPIDHCLVLGNVNGVSFNSMSLDGSDHEAIIANLAMDANGKE